MSGVYEVGLESHLDHLISAKMTQPIGKNYLCTQLYTERKEKV